MAFPVDKPRLGPLILTAFIDNFFTSADVNRFSKQGTSESA
jgi:hypothetical protein